MAITNRKKHSKIPERFVFITSPILYLWLFGFAFGPMNNWGTYGCAVETNQIHETLAYYDGCVGALFLVPILLGTSYLATGLYLRRNRIKKDN